MAIALGTALSLGGLDFGLFTVSGSSLFIPAIIIGVVYVPYMAKPLRGQVLGIREKEFVEAARAQGAGNFRILSQEVLPNGVEVAQLEYAETLTIGMASAVSKTLLGELKEECSAARLRYVKHRHQHSC